MKSLKITALLILALLAFYGSMHAVRQTWQRLPWVKAGEWNATFLAKKNRLSSQTWLDTRPLNVLVGDSHIEYGNWYSAMQGEFSVMNCGMATARIQDVTELLQNFTEKKIKTLIIHCGINNIGNQETAEVCLAQYQKLLDAAARLNPQKIVIIPVIPVRERPLDSISTKTNITVKRFNSMLKVLCDERGFILHDIAHRVTCENAGLKEKYTDDGLHLNKSGYTQIYPEICNILRNN